MYGPHVCMYVSCTLCSLIGLTACTNSMYVCQTPVGRGSTWPQRLKSKASLRKGKGFFVSIPTSQNPSRACEWMVAVSCTLTLWLWLLILWWILQFNSSDHIHYAVRIVHYNPKASTHSASYEISKMYACTVYVCVQCHFYIRVHVCACTPMYVCCSIITRETLLECCVFLA